MKMSQNTYNHIEMAIKGLRDYCSDSNEFNKLRESIPYAKDQFTSFVWKIYYASKNYYNIDLHVLVSSEGLNDSHIESALKKILKSYK